MHIPGASIESDWGVVFPLMVAFPLLTTTLEVPSVIRIDPTSFSVTSVTFYLYIYIHIYIYISSTRTTFIDTYIII
jgi:hypothetical protein